MYYIQVVHFGHPLPSAQWVGSMSPLSSPVRPEKGEDPEATFGRHLAWLRAEWRRGGPAREALEALVERQLDGRSLVLHCDCSAEGAACHARAVAHAVHKTAFSRLKI